MTSAASAFTLSSACFAVEKWGESLAHFNCGPVSLFARYIVICGRGMDEKVKLPFNFLRSFDVCGWPIKLNLIMRLFGCAVVR